MMTILVEESSDVNVAKYTKTVATIIFAYNYNVAFLNRKLRSISM